ncbi:hypothetical protein XENORESO_016026, partial [Xenotaenia resolanae]
PEGVLETLKCLNLSCNPLMQESVCRLSTLPRLEQLDLSSTRLSFVQLEDAAQGCCCCSPQLALCRTSSAKKAKCFKSFAILRKTIML